MVRGKTSRRSAGVNPGPRVAAARTLALVLGGASLTHALSAQRLGLSASDHALASELSYGGCRWYYQLQAILQQIQHKKFKSADLDIHALTLIGLYQLLFTRIPEHAAVSETAGAARVLGKHWAVAVVNGILRRFQRERKSLLEEVMTSPQVVYSQPHWIIDSIERDWPDDAQGLLESLLQRPPFTVRVNLSRIGLPEYASKLTVKGITARPVNAVPSALILDAPIAVDKLPGFAQGLVSVQDAGAQLAALFLDPKSGMDVLDACAAPGGKTGHMLEYAPGIRVTAVDLDEERLTKVAENIQRLGLEARLVQGDASKPAGDWSKQLYDRILLDVPCSATGVMRRHPDIKILRRYSDIETLVHKQRQIMDAAWLMLKPGGKMLYATCSILAQENAQQVSAFLNRHQNVTVLKLKCSGATPCDYGLQILPMNRTMDGFYYALLEKT